MCAGRRFYRYFAAGCRRLAAVSQLTEQPGNGDSALASTHHVSALPGVQTSAAVVLVMMSLVGAQLAQTRNIFLLSHVENCRSEVERQFLSVGN